MALDQKPQSIVTIGIVQGNWQWQGRLDDRILQDFSGDVPWAYFYCTFA